MVEWGYSEEEGEVEEEEEGGIGKCLKGRNRTGYRKNVLWKVRRWR